MLAGIKYPCCYMILLPVLPGPYNKLLRTVKGLIGSYDVKKPH